MSNAMNLETLTGIITRVYHASPRWSAGQLRTDSGAFEKFAGNLYAVTGDRVVLRGEWSDDPKWGMQFKVESLGFEEGIDAAGLANWLQGHEAAHGIGKTKAQRLVEQFGSEFEWTLLNDPAKIAKAVNVPVETIQVLAEKWQEAREFNAVATHLAAWGLTNHQCYILTEKFGASIIKLLDQDPYLLIGEIQGLGFRRVDDIAQKRGVPKDHPGRIRAALLYSLTQALDEGSTCLFHYEMLVAAEKLLVLDNLDSENLINDRLKSLADAGKEIQRIIASEREYFAFASIHYQEQAVANFMHEARGRNPHFAMNPGLEEQVRSSWEGEFDESQFRAVLTALSRRAVLISGGAGSGKTHSIKMILRACQRDGKSVALAAPTGKAARRMTEVTGHDASTIHRLLCYHPKLGFQVNSRNPLSCDVLIIDEASMIDVPLAFALVDAISSETSVVFVGDHHQLPPVGPGAILRDAISRELIPLVLLNQCHRQAGTLKQNCSAILSGTIAKTEVADPKTLGAWYIHGRLDDPEEVLTCIEKLYRYLPEWKLDPMLDVQFLTPVHKGPLGTRAINALLQCIRQEELGNVVPERDPERPPKLLTGDKVIYTKNNYDQNVMNGHMGVVLQANPLVIEFDDRTVAVPKEREGEVELGYCITPHKAQGSEWPFIVTVCHRLHSFMHHRGWIYTAATRARRACAIIGDERSIKEAARKVKINERRTLLGLLEKVSD